MTSSFVRWLGGKNESLEVSNFIIGGVGWRLQTCTLLFSFNLALLFNSWGIMGCFIFFTAQIK